MPWIKIWLHFVWSTKDRYPYLQDDIRGKAFEHIKQNAKEKGIFIDFINGHIDHVHCLISLSGDQTIAWIMQSIKGESSFWINKNKLTKARFAWQDEYFVASVSPSAVMNVRDYIRNQEEHHKKAGFAEELERFLSKAGFESFRE